MASHIEPEQKEFLVNQIAKQENEVEKIVLVSGKDSQKVEVHRVILAAMSTFFEKHLTTTSTHIEIVVDDVDGRFLKEIVAFVRTGNIEIHADNILQMLNFASTYKFDSLHEKCVNFCVGQLSFENSVEWLMFADQHHMVRLRQLAFRMICMDFDRIPCYQMRKMDFANFKQVISVDENAADEEIIFDRLVDWLHFDESERKEWASELLHCVRLKHISDKAMIDKVMDFCQRHNIIGFTDEECSDRLLKPRRIFQSRYAHSRCVFETHEKGTSIIVRAFDGVWNCWRKHITINHELLMKYYGVVFTTRKLFLIGGCTESGRYLKRVNEFDFETKTYSIRADMKTERAFVQPILIDGFIYVFGGFNGTAIRDCERLNMRSGEWEALAPMQHPRHSCTVSAVNGYIFVADGCLQNKGNCCSVQRYDPANDKWMNVAGVANPLFEGVLVEWKSKLYAASVNGGMERYDSQQNTWVTPDIADSRDDEVLYLLRKFQLVHFDYYRERLIVAERHFFVPFCPGEMNKISLTDFSQNLVLPSRDVCLTDQQSTNEEEETVEDFDY